MGLVLVGVLGHRDGISAGSAWPSFSGLGKRGLSVWPGLLELGKGLIEGRSSLALGSHWDGGSMCEEVEVS